MLKVNVTSSLEKVFADTKPSDYPEFKGCSVLKGENVAFQIAYTYVVDEGDGNNDWVRLYKINFAGPLAPYATVKKVANVPVERPVTLTHDDKYLRTTPGLYPDPIMPLNYGGRFRSNYRNTSALWIELDVPEDMPAGECLLSFDIVTTEEETETTVYSGSLTFDVINAALPPQTTYFTQWFHCDCLSRYYRVPVWSERHWQIIENFAKVAVRCGINTLLTPLVTPSLDGPRDIAQLTRVTKTAGKYRFNFSLLDRWIDMCDRVGIKYFEISHLFTQGGAYHTPRIVAKVDGEEQMIFSYATPGDDPEYRVFLRALIKAFLRHMKKRGDDKRCIFHISDEPPIRAIEVYRKAKETVADLLDGYMMIDALSDLEYWEQGLVETPVPMIQHAKHFVESGVKDMWTYNCLAPSTVYSNRFIAMPSWRNRSVGMQMFKYNVKGFLHWGYNFYNNRSSTDLINPYSDVSGEYWTPAGDTFSVYPAGDGTAVETVRTRSFFHALQDVRAMQLCDTLGSHEATVAVMEQAFGESIEFERCAYSAEELLRVREAVNLKIKELVGVGK